MERTDLGECLEPSNEGLGTFVRVTLTNSDEYDFDVETGARLLGDFKAWHQSDDYSEFSGKTLCGGDISFPVCAIVAIYTSTPETRAAVRARTKLFEAENEDSRDWSS